MAQIAVAPIVLKDTLLSIATDNYEAHVSGVTFTPTAATVEWRGLTPNAVFTDVSTETWTVVVETVQDWVTPDSLSRYLFANAGTKVDMTFKPQSGVGPTFEAEVTLVSGPIGGVGQAVPVGSVTLGVSGRPTLVDPSTPSAWAATTAYVVGDRVSIASGSVVLRALTAGTSGASAPAAPGRSNVVINGTVAWLQTV
ncbi:hypothetical protein [Jiangella muralis]|uniref:hypothetical protein n=1 Tax=Jiangella muralis TaxID=702383 RepID=UPI00069E1CDE|nr:hypothetical protein [Jiangella muralis]